MLKLGGFVAAASISMLGTLPAAAGSSWSGTINCSWGSGSLSLSVDDQGSVSGSVTNGTVKSGRVRGSSISFNTSNFFGNNASFTGSISGTSMSGQYIQSTSGETCTFQASRIAGATQKAAQRKTKDGETPEKEACGNVEQELRSARKIERQIAVLSKSPEDQIKGCRLAMRAYNGLEQISAAHCPKQKSALKQLMTKMHNTLCTEREFDDWQRQIDVRKYNRNVTSGGGVRG